MKMQVTFNDFWNMYKFSGDYQKCYTVEGARKLFEYLESIEEQTRQEIEFQYIVIACEYKEATIEKYKEIYKYENDEECNDRLDDDEFIIDRYVFDNQEYVLYQEH